MHTPALYCIETFGLSGKASASRDRPGINEPNNTPTSRPAPILVNPGFAYCIRMLILVLNLANYHKHDESSRHTAQVKQGLCIYIATRYTIEGLHEDGN